MLNTVIMSVTLESVFLVVGFLLQGVGILIAFRQMKKNSEKEQEQKLKDKVDVEQFKDYKFDIKCKMEATDILNTRSHAEIIAHIDAVEMRNDRQHDILREDYHRGLDQIEKLIKSSHDGLTKQIDILIKQGKK